MKLGANLMTLKALRSEWKDISKLLLKNFYCDLATYVCLEDVYGRGGKRRCFIWKQKHAARWREKGLNTAGLENHEIYLKQAYQSLLRPK